MKKIIGLVMVLVLATSAMGIGSSSGAGAMAGFNVSDMGYDSVREFMEDIPNIEKQITELELKETLTVDEKDKLIQLRYKMIVSNIID